MVRKTTKAMADEIKKYYGVGDSLSDALKVLQTNGIINSPDYWLKNAVTNGTVKGEYVAILIENMAKKLGGK